MKLASPHDNTPSPFDISDQLRTSCGRMTLKTVRIIVVGGDDDTGKTAFIESLGAVATEGSTTDEKSITFKIGDDLIRFVFVELPSNKFKTFFVKRSAILPAEFKNGHGRWPEADNCCRQKQGRSDGG
eukprot:scaffold336919_cov31-Attheya_sp.AAC.1